MMNREMLSGEHQEVLDVLGRLMQEHSNWRIGQIVANIAFLARQTESATWDVEDAEFVQTAKQHLQRAEERHEDTARTKREVQETMTARQKVAA